MAAPVPWGGSVTVWSGRLSSLELVAVLSLLDQGDALSDIAGPEAEPAIRKLVQLYLSGVAGSAQVCGPDPLPAKHAEQPGPDPLEPRTERWSRQVS